MVSFLPLIDDVLLMTKRAMGKSLGVLGDDLALTAGQVNGLTPARELPLIWKIAKGSLVNKGILIAAGLGISAAAPAWVIPALLTMGGAYLCYEGVEKQVHKFMHKDKNENENKPIVDIEAFENGKVKEAVKTDFILSAEIMTIILGSVAGASMAVQLGTLVTSGLVMTAGVYLPVAGIVKIDDVALHFMEAKGDSFAARAKRASAPAILKSAAVILKGLSVFGTAAMFTVGGAIVVHSIPGGHDVLHAIQHGAAHLPYVGAVLGPIAPMVAEGLGGVIAGALLLPLVESGKKVAGAVTKLFKPSAPEKKPDQVMAAPVLAPQAVVLSLSPVMAKVRDTSPPSAKTALDAAANPGTEAVQKLPESVIVPPKPPEGPRPPAV